MLRCENKRQIRKVNSVEDILALKCVLATGQMGRLVIGGNSLPLE